MKYNHLEEKEYLKILSAPKVQKILLHIPHARNLRELAKITKMPPTTVQNIVNKLKSIGRLKFIPDYSYFGLINVATIVQTKYPIDYSSLPFGTTALREFKGIGLKISVIYGLVPNKLKQTYIEKLTNTVDGDIIDIVESKEFMSWKPEEDFIVFLNNKGIVPVIDKLHSILEQSKFSPKYKENNWVPDEIDLKILAGKIVWGPYKRPSIILRSINNSEDKPVPPKQTISYHYKNHVLKGWKYNTFHYYLPVRKVPFIALYLRGREAPALARALLALPGSMFAYLDENKAYILAQYPCNLLHDVFSLTSVADVEAPLGILMMKLDFKAKLPKLWWFLNKVGRRYEWRWPVETLVKLRN